MPTLFSYDDDDDDSWKKLKIYRNCRENLNVNHLVNQ